MSYRDKTVTVELPELGDGCQITLKNPMLYLRMEDAETLATLDGVGEAKERFRALVGPLITAWVMWDIETDDPLPIPSESQVVWDRAPDYVLNKLMGEVGRLINPTSPPTKD